MCSSDLGRRQCAGREGLPWAARAGAGETVAVTLGAAGVAEAAGRTGSDVATPDWPRRRLDASGEGADMSVGGGRSC